jgi:hypothetical protein
LTYNAVIRQFSTHPSLPVDPKSPPKNIWDLVEVGASKPRPVQHSIRIIKLYYIYTMFLV